MLKARKSNRKRLRKKVPFAKLHVSTLLIYKLKKLFIWTVVAVVAIQSQTTIHHLIIGVVTVSKRDVKLGRKRGKKGILENIFVVFDSVEEHLMENDFSVGFEQRAGNSQWTFEDEIIVKKN